MKKSQHFTDLIVWQKSHELVLLVYKITETFPKTEIFGLVTQMRRSAISVPGNISEGYKRRGKKDKVRFLNIAEGSLEELRYYFILATDLKYMKNEKVFSLAEEVSKLLYSYSNSILSSVS